MVVFIVLIYFSTYEFVLSLFAHTSLPPTLTLKKLNTEMIFNGIQKQLRAMLNLCMLSPVSVVKLITMLNALCYRHYSLHYHSLPYVGILRRVNQWQSK